VYKDKEQVIFVYDKTPTVAAALFSILILLTAPFAPLLPQNVMASPAAEQMPSPYDHIKLTTVPGTVGYKLKATSPEGAKFTSEVRLIPKAVYKLTAEDVERAKKVACLYLVETQRH
jgi:hypothetical protein